MIEMNMGRDAVLKHVKVSKMSKGGLKMLKKCFVTLVSFLMAFSLSINVSATSSIQSDDYQSKSLVALGDSITSGYGLFQTLKNPVNPNILNQRLVSQNAYPQLVGDAIGYRVSNLAVSGWTSTDLLEMITFSNRYRTAIGKADVILLNIGGNDVLGYLINVDFAEFDLWELLEEIEARLLIYYYNLGFILKEIRQLNPTAPILQYGFYNPLYVGHPLEPVLGDGFEDLYDFLNFLIYAINDFVLNDIVYDEHGSPVYNPVSGFLSYAEFFDFLFYVDVFSAFETYGYYFRKSYLFADEVHPSQQGHQLLAEITLAALLN